MLKRLLLVLALASLVAAQAPGPNVNSGRFMAANYGQWQVQVQSTPTGKACVSPVTVSLADGSQLNPWNTNASVLIGSGANAETVTPTAFNFTQTPGQVCISGTFTKTHFFGEPVLSGTFGLQEALNAAGVKGGGAVAIDQNWAALGGTTAIKNAAALPANVLVEDVRTGTAGASSPILNTQGPQSAITGTGANATAFTATLPAQTTGSVITVYANLFKNSGTANFTVTLTLNGQTVCTGPGDASASANVSANLFIKLLVLSNTTAIPLGQCTIGGVAGSGALISSGVGNTISGLNFSGTQTLLVQFNTTAAAQITPEALVVEQN